MFSSAGDFFDLSSLRKSENSDFFSDYGNEYSPLIMCPISSSPIHCFGVVGKCIHQASVEKSLTQQKISCSSFVSVRSLLEKQ